MKTCPTCKRTYPNDAPPFCAEDGTRLTIETSTESSAENLSQTRLAVAPADAKPALPESGPPTTSAPLPPQITSPPPPAPAPPHYSAPAQVGPARASPSMRIATLALVLGFVCLILMVHLAYSIGAFGSIFRNPPFLTVVLGFYGMEFFLGMILLGAIVVSAGVAILLANKNPQRYAGAGRSVAGVLMGVLSALVVMTMFTFRRFEHRPQPIYPSYNQTTNTPPSVSSAYDLLTARIGSFNRIDSSREVNAPNPQLGLILFLNSKDAAEGTYRSSSNSSSKLIVLKYDSPAAASSVVSKIRDAMRNGPNRVSSLTRTSGDALVADGSNSTSLVMWNNSQWVFVTFGDSQQARELSQAVVW